jgi:signal transduction histidine kinase
MIERMKQAGGTLDIDSGHWGTSIKARVPKSSLRFAG